MKLTYTTQQLYDWGSILADTVGGFASGGIGGAAMGAAMGIGSTLSQQQQQQQQITMQGTLGGMQVQNQEDLMNYNEQEQLKFWNATNYQAQMAQLQAAGLNPALLYAKGGTGGSTMPGAPSAGMGIAPSAGNTAQTNAANMQALETAADVKLKNAQAENIAAQTPQEGDLMKANIDSINQGINNQKAEEILTDAKTQTQRLQNSITGASQDDQIAAIQATASKIQQEAQMAVRNNYIDQNTMNDRMAIIHGTMIGTYINNNLQKAQTTNIQQNTTQSIQSIAQQWQQLSINKQNANTQEGQLKIQQFINDISHGDAILKQGLTKLIPSIVIGL